MSHKIVVEKQPEAIFL